MSKSLLILLPYRRRASFVGLGLLLWHHRSSSSQLKSSRSGPMAMAMAAVYTLGMMRGVGCGVWGVGCLCRSNQHHLLSAVAAEKCAVATTHRSNSSAIGIGSIKQLDLCFLKIAREFALIILRLFKDFHKAHYVKLARPGDHNPPLHSILDLHRCSFFNSCAPVVIIGQHSMVHLCFSASLLLWFFSLSEVTRCSSSMNSSL